MKGVNSVWADVFCFFFFQTCGYKGEYSIKGVLSLEHLGRPHGVHDGMCISILLEAKSADLESGRGYEWCLLKQDLVDPIQHALARNCAELATLNWYFVGILTTPVILIIIITIFIFKKKKNDFWLQEKKWPSGISCKPVAVA